MITIPPQTSSVPSLLPHDGAASGAADVPPAAAEPTRTGEAPAEAKSRFDDLFGAAPMQHFHADANGAGGGGATRKAKAAPDPMAGAPIPGQKGVVVQRSLGDPAGYETKHHAIAWARAVGSDRAMVVLGKDNRWHAVETNKVATDATGGKGAIKTAIQVGKVDAEKYASLRKEAMKDNDAAKWKTFAAYALGVPEDEIEVIGKGGTPSSTKININLSPDFNAEGRAANFDPKQPPWVQLGPLAFDRPANAAATLAHEEVHARHRRIAIDLYGQYEKAPHGTQSFREWVAKQAKGTEGYWRAEIVAGYQDGRTAATELEAHVEAARVAFASGDLEQAKTDLRKVATLPVLPKITQPSIDQLKALKASLSGDALAVFQGVADKAKDLSVLHGLRTK